METKKLLEQRKRTKKTKPVFVVKESKFVSRVKSRWRFPRGKHSAVRQGHKGRPNLPQPGYGAPNLVRGLHSSGLKPIVVKNKQELLNVDKKTQGVVLSRTVGKRKKLELLRLAQEKSITLLQIKDSTALIKKITEEFAARKTAKQEKVKEKSKKTEEKKKKAQEKEKKEQEEKKEEQKEEQTLVDEKVQTKEDKEKKMIEKTITKRQ